jgi:hypothetical protein
MAAPDPRVVGARNDALLMQSMNGISGGEGNYLTAINGVVSGVGGAMKGYQQIKSATPVATTTPNTSWKFNASGGKIA